MSVQLSTYLHTEMRLLLFMLPKLLADQHDLEG